VWWFIQDACKVGAYWLLERYNWFEYNNVGTVVLPETTVNYIHQHKQADMDSAAQPHGAATAPQKHL
jgi:hypothetical protein